MPGMHLHARAERSVCLRSGVSLSSFVVCAALYQKDGAGEVPSRRPPEVERAGGLTGDASTQRKTHDG